MTPNKYVRGRRIRMIALIIAAILAVPLVMAYLFLPRGMEFGNSGIFEESVVKEKMKDVVNKFNQNDYEALQAEAVKEMQSALTKEQMQDARQQIAGDWGDYQSFGQIYMMELRQMGRNYVVGEITVVYEHVSVTFRLTFDADMRLAGLYIR